MIGVIGGASLVITGELEEEISLRTSFGEPSSSIKILNLKGKRFAFLQRHGPKGEIPPHRINHRANLEAFFSLGIRKVIGVNSVGSLKREIPPGSIVVPHDFFCPWAIVTFFEDKAFHVLPSLDEELRKALIKACKKNGFLVFEQGVYVQTIGPRLETKAEVLFLSRLGGDVVGMTMAHEATLCCERGISYASLCTVDNYAHGIGEGGLSQEKIKEMAQKNAQKVIKVLEELES
jgi:5'-methylthioadenosine phosphorylase